MKVFSFAKPYRCYAALADRILVPHDIAVTGSNYAAGRAAIIGYAKLLLEDPKVIKVLAPLQEWEGYVTEVLSEGYVEVNLVDVTAQSDDVDSMGTVPVDLFEPEDRPLLAEGVLFRAFCGYTMFPNSDPSEIEMTFVLFPALTEVDIEEARLRVAAATMTLIRHD